MARMPKISDLTPNVSGWGFFLCTRKETRSGRTGNEYLEIGLSDASGDMGAMMNIGELETCMRENIPVVYVVFNDQGLGNERAFQNEHYGGRLFAVDYKNPDFGALAKVFGAHGEHVTRPGDLEGALQRAFASGKPAIVDVMIDQKTLAPVVYKA